MNIEEVREYCLSLPLVTEDMAFGEDHLLLRLFDKIFACMALDNTGTLALKADPELAIDLRERHTSITPARHWNKKYWIQLDLRSSLPDHLIESLIRHSYSQVVSKLPKKLKTSNPSITRVSSDLSI